MFDSLMQIIAPHHCYVCGKIGHLLCLDCKNNIVNDGFEGCILCRKITSGNGVCRKCTDDFSRAWCIGEREDELRVLIDNYKFNNTKAAASDIASLFDMYLPELPDDIIVVPVPSTATHVRVRGYDHVALFAKRFAERRNLTFKPMLRNVSSATQRDLSRQDRFSNAKNAFRVSHPLDGERVLLFDDVVTTGATLQFSAKRLRDAGAADIWAAALSRQPLE